MSTKSKRIAAIGVVSLFLVPFIVRVTKGDDGAKVQAEQVRKHHIKASILASGNLAYGEQALLSPEGVKLRGTRLLLIDRQNLA